MSEQNRRNNWPHTISPQVPEEVLRTSISVIAPAMPPRIAPELGHREPNSSEGDHLAPVPFRPEKVQIEIMGVILQPDI